MALTPDPQRTLLTSRILAGDLGLAPIWFDPSVLDRYREQPGTRVMRTNSVGRVRSRDGWSLDFGISEDESVIHATAGDLAQRLPSPERSHWAQHALGPGLSRNFLSMRLGAGSCVDDGDLRDWSGT